MSFALKQLFRHNPFFVFCEVFHYFYYFIQLPLCFASFFSISFLFHLVFLSRSASALSGLPCNSQCKLCCLWSTWSYMTARRFQCKFKLMMLIKFIHQTLTFIVASYIQIHKGLVYIYIYIYIQFKLLSAIILKINVLTCCQCNAVWHSTYDILIFLLGVI